MEYVGGPLDGGRAMICCELAPTGSVCIHGVRTRQTETVALYWKCSKTSDEANVQMHFLKSMSVEQYIEARNEGLR